MVRDYKMNNKKNADTFEQDEIRKLYLDKLNELKAKYNIPDADISNVIAVAENISYRNYESRGLKYHGGSFPHEEAMMIGERLELIHNLEQACEEIYGSQDYEYEMSDTFEENYQRNLIELQRKYNLTDNEMLYAMSKASIMADNYYKSKGWKYHFGSINGHIAVGESFIFFKYLTKLCKEKYGYRIEDRRRETNED